ncbi:D-alanyl-D-alanine carboxypeptidase [Kibdelosporangium aridum]|uniref:D-alanyl-D-alanine carboxypeptidase n=1 Tax=Kibdelosporangium aridum TaxID=2030 RepID=A0A428ZD36_KIBAR|nr:D-alanyl-D-alanine carboxypeptidase family protein [Kibdelosporangium aridum]RSM85971.1 D-alanyl-D-alanine carboxypeptidase [Kibdelosporangium aridum]
MTTRDRAMELAAKALARVLLPFAQLNAPGHARHVACQWALGMRFPKEDLTGLTAATYAAFTTARTEAFWRDGQLIGLTSGHRDAAVQHRMYIEDLRRPGLTTVLHPAESQHVRGTAMDIRPREGARWMEENGERYKLYRTYDNEWWHFEYRQRRPERLPYPGAVRAYK